MPTTHIRVPCTNTTYNKLAYVLKHSHAALSGEAISPVLEGVLNSLGDNITDLEGRLFENESLQDGRWRSTGTSGYLDGTEYAAGVFVAAGTRKRVPQIGNIITFGDERIETRIDINYETGYRVNDRVSLVSRVTGKIGDTEIDLHYVRGVFDQGFWDITRVHGKIGQDTMDIRLDFRGPGAHVYINDQHAYIQPEIRETEKRQPAYAR